MLIVRFCFRFYPLTFYHPAGKKKYHTYACFPSFCRVFSFDVYTDATLRSSETPFPRSSRSSFSVGCELAKTKTRLPKSDVFRNPTCRKRFTAAPALESSMIKNLKIVRRYFFATEKTDVNYSIFSTTFYATRTPSESSRPLKNARTYSPSSEFAKKANFQQDTPEQCHFHPRPCSVAIIPFFFRRLSHDRQKRIICLRSL